jgi:hypothetical protein
LQFGEELVELRVRVREQLRAARGFRHQDLSGDDAS